jgi:NTE family protein
MKLLFVTIQAALILISQPMSLHADSRTVASADLNSIVQSNFTSHDSTKRPFRIALALSGGGARGLAQVGVLQVFEENNIPVDLVVGTSMGGVIGGLWAAGYSADSIESLVKSIDWQDLFSDRPQRSRLFLTQRELGESHLLSVRFDGLRPTIPTALTAGQKLNSILSRLAIEANYRSRHDFDNLKIPLRVCAVDILTAEPVVLSKGNLADALRATISVPIAFTPLESDSMLLMDGGLLNPIPVGVARDEGADYVIAVNTTSPLLERELISDAIDIANQTTTVMQLEARRRDLELADVVISPELGPHFATDFTGIDSLIEEGRKAAENFIPEIKSEVLRLQSEDLKQKSIEVDSVSLADRAGDIEELQVMASIIERRGSINADQLHTAMNLAIENRRASRIGAVLDTSLGKKVLRIDSDIIREDAGIKWSGNNSITTEELSSMVIDTAGGDRSTLSQIADRTTNAYRNRGYDLIEIDSVTYAKAGNQIVFHINEGLTGDVRVFGNEHTRGWVIRRNFTLKTDEPFNLRKVDRGMTNIISTGLFDRVKFDVSRGGGRANVNIEVKERYYKVIRLGAHYHEHYHAETFVDFADANLLGYSHELLLRVMYGEKRKSYGLYLKADRIFETYFTYALSLFHERLKRDVYVDNQSVGLDRERETGGRLAFGQQIARLGTLTAEATAKKMRVEMAGTGELVHQNIRSLTIRSRLDNMDRSVFPTKGVASHMYLEFAYDVLGGDIRYKKAYFDWRAQIPLPSHFGFMPAFAIGGSDVELPRWEKYFLGGNRNFYGFHHDALEGDKMFVANIGLEYRLPYRFYLRGRYDFGNVWTTLEEIAFRNLRHAVGGELSYDSPLGPISLSYGRAENTFDRFYLNVGFEF